MIEGKVNSKLDAVVKLEIFNREGVVFSVDAVVDTGYSGTLALPPSYVEYFGLEIADSVLKRLGDGSTLAIGRYRGKIKWNDSVVEVLVDGLGDEPLIGMKLMKDHHLAIHVIDGGIVMIKTG